MAASNTNTNSTGDDNSSPNSMSTLAQQLLHKPAFKRLVVIIVTFIPAFLALSIINVIFTHVFVLSSYYLVGTTPHNAAVTTGSSWTSSGSGDENIVAATQKKVKKVYVPPTEKDLEQLLIELESSEPLSSNNNLNHGESAIKRAQSAIDSLQSLMERKTSGVDTAVKEMGELAEAYDSFVTRFEEDIAHYRANHEQTETVLDYLPQFMKRNSLFDLDRGTMDDLFENVVADLNVLLKDDVILRNSNDALMKLLSSNKLGNKEASSCDLSFLDVAKGNPTSELDIAIAPKQKIATANKQVENDAIITQDTARESDLYERIDSIKDILSRRDLSGDKNPIDEEGVAAIRAEVAAMVLTLLKSREDGHATTKEITEHLIKETSVVSNESNPEDDTDTALCASPVMVEKMVQRGLDSIRIQADLQSTLISTVFTVVADENEDDELRQIMGALDKEMSDIDVQRIDFNKKSSGDDENKNMSPKSDKRKTLSYVVDGPLLHQGVAGSIDSFVELISGYNDYVDEFFDYIMSRQGVSVGTAASDGISNLVRKVPLPELEKLRRSGILGGRIRTLVDN